MIRCLTDNRAFTLVEMMIAVGFSVVLLAGVIGFYNTASQSYSSGVSGQALQDGADIILSKIIEGEAESGNVYRLSTAVAYMIPNGGGSELYSCGGTARTAPCNAANPYSEVYYCQDSPCSGSSDATARWYYLNDSATSVLYHHPVSGGGTVEETLYTAPAGSTITLRFSPAAVGVPSEVLEIDVALTPTLASNVTNSRLAASGAASTFVLLRNHP